MLKQFLPVKSDFILTEINPIKRIVVVEDPSLGLQCEIPIGEGNLSAAEIIDEYKIKLIYQDGSSKEIAFLRE